MGKERSQEFLRRYHSDVNNYDILKWHLLNAPAIYNRMAYWNASSSPDKEKFLFRCDCYRPSNAEYPYKDYERFHQTSKKEADCKSEYEQIKTRSVVTYR